MHGIENVFELKILGVNKAFIFYPKELVNYFQISNIKLYYNSYLLMIIYYY